MKKLLLAMLLTATQSVAFASVTAVKWGEDTNKVLRVVADLTEATNFDVKIENKILTVAVHTPYEGSNYAEPVRSVYAEQMKVTAMGTKTVIELPLVQELSEDDVHFFTLKQDPVTKRPSRIVVDIAKKKENSPLAMVPAVQSDGTQVTNVMPKVTVGSMSPPAAESPKTQVAQIPELVRKPLPTTNSVSVGSQPARSTVSAAVPPKVTVSSPQSDLGVKVSVGSMPTNKSEAQARASQRGKEAVDAILGRVASGQAGKAPDKKPTDTKGIFIPPGSSVSSSGAGNEPAGTPSPKEPIITDSVPIVQVVTSSKPAANVKETRKSEYGTKGGIKGKVITIDPGHGGSDPGAVSDKNTYEKTITLSMAKKLKSELVKMGATVYLTRSTDTDVCRPYADDEEELQARVDVAEKRCSDLFVSLHINASVNKKASGISTYYFHKSNYDDKLAKCIHKQLTANFKLPDMGVREANFYVIKRCSMPAVLMELGFISNKKEEKVISGNWFQNKAMDLVAAGIKDYFK